MATDPAAYGVRETNPIEPGYHEARQNNRGPERGAYWTTPGLTITRLRLISDPGYPDWDVSYCHGRLDGKDVDVHLPFSHLPRRGTARAIIEAAKADGLYAKGTGILDAISTLI